MLSVFLLVGGAAALVAGAILAIHETPEPKSEPAALAKQSTPVPEKYRARPDDLEFYHVLMREFPNTPFTGADQVETGQYGSSVISEFYVMHKSDLNAEFYVAYIPKMANAKTVLNYLFDKYKNIRNSMAPSKEAIDQAKKQNAAINAPLPFTGKIFVYHEAKISKDEIAGVTEKLKERGVVVEFRGPEYVAQKRKEAAKFYKFSVER